MLSFSVFNLLLNNLFYYFHGKTLAFQFFHRLFYCFIMFGGDSQLRQIQYRNIIRIAHILHFHPIDNHTYRRSIVGNRVDQDK